MPKKQTRRAEYIPGVIAEIMSFPELAVTFRNVAQIGLEYKFNTLVIGEFNPETGAVTSHASYTNMPCVEKARALRILEQERDKAFKPDFAPKVALVVDGKVMVRGEPHQKVLKPYKFRLEGETYIAKHNPDMIRSKSVWAPIDIVVYGKDIATIQGIAVPNTEDVLAISAGRSLERALGLKYGDIGVEVGTTNFYLSGRPTLQGDSGFTGDYFEFKSVENIAVLVRRDSNRNLTFATPNPSLKERVKEGTIEEAVHLARRY